MPASEYQALAAIRKRKRGQVDDSILSKFVVRGHGGARRGCGRRKGSSSEKPSSPKRRPKHHLSAPRRLPRGPPSAIEQQAIAQDMYYRRYLQEKERADTACTELAQSRVLNPFDWAQHDQQEAKQQLRKWQHSAVQCCITR